MMRRGRRQTGRQWAAAAFALLAAAGTVARADPFDPAPAFPPTTRPAGGPVDEVGGDTPLPTSPGDHKLRFRTHVAGRQVDMAYLLHLPPGYDADVPATNPADRRPMLVFLHGAGECGTDLAGVYALGPMYHLRKGGDDPDLANSCPLVVLCPQCPPRGQKWNDDYMYKALMVLIDGAVRRSHVDPDRVYVTGLSMGGLGTWCVAEHDANRFAAVAPMSALAWHPEVAGPVLKTVPVWAVAGLGDEPRFIDGTRAMQAALAGAPADRRFTYLMGNGHDAFYPMYVHADWYEWLLSHRRPPTPAARQQWAACPPPPVDTPVPTTPGHHFCTVVTKVADQPYQLDYVVYLPKGYTPAKRYPTLLFLRESDTVGPDYHDVCVHGPDLALERHPPMQDGFPFVVVSPHLPVKCDWQMPGMSPMLLGLLDHLKAGGLGIDPDRVTVTGVNGGANGAWKLVTDAPDRFAALVPVETAGPVWPTDETVSAAARTVPGRAFVVAGDTGSVDRVQRLAGGHDWRTVPLPPAATPLGELPPYTDPATLAWVAAQTRPPAPAASANAK